MKYNGRIVQFGFGAVGKSFYEKVSREIQFQENNYYVITANAYEFEAYVNLGGLVSNFIVVEVTRDNYQQVFAAYLSEGDLLIDFADTVGTADFCGWCAEKNIMYLNTGEADWPDHWYSIFEENEKKTALQLAYANCREKNKYPIVVHHGNNPGLVSHFVKAALQYIVHTQFKKDKELKRLVRNGEFHKVAESLGVRAIHVNDIDLQKVKGAYKEQVLYTPWCMDSFWFEMLSEATAHLGTHEICDYPEMCNLADMEKGYVEFSDLAANKKCKTYYPGGKFEGYMVPHEEIVSIAKSLEVKEGEKVVYRPTVLFLYEPCEYAVKFFKNAKVNDYPNPDPDKPQDCEEAGGKTIIRGYTYPNNVEIMYKENIDSGTEYVGVLLMGEKFEPVWVGNRIEPEYLYKDKKQSYWQTPTITPVSMSALAAVCWMLKNKDKGGIYFPDDIPDYRAIIKTAEKYISKTLYHTFSKEKLAEELEIDFENLCLQDMLV